MPKNIPSHYFRQMEDEFNRLYYDSYEMDLPVNYFLYGNDFPYTGTFYGFYDVPFQYYDHAYDSFEVEYFPIKNVYKNDYYYGNHDVADDTFDFDYDYYWFVNSFSDFVLVLIKKFHFKIGYGLYSNTNSYIPVAWLLLLKFSWLQSLISLWS